MIGQEQHLVDEVKRAKVALKKAVLGDNPFSMILNSVVEMQADVFKSK
jgi:hypothetical protein